VLILGPIVDEHEDALVGRLSKKVSRRLRFAVDPVEVFEDQEEGLDAALGEEQALTASSVRAGVAAGSLTCQSMSSTGMSSGAKRAGTEGSSARSSVSSFPVIFSPAWC